MRAIAFLTYFFSFSHIEAQTCIVIVIGSQSGVVFNPPLPKQLYVWLCSYTYLLNGFNPNFIEKQDDK